jgi:hypothetical protein
MGAYNLLKSKQVVICGVAIASAYIVNLTVADTILLMNLVVGVQIGELIFNRSQHKKEELDQRNEKRRPFELGESNELSLTKTFK